jgi:hypothetical protein
MAGSGHRRGVSLLAQADKPGLSDLLHFPKRTPVFETLSSYLDAISRHFD